MSDNQNPGHSRSGSVPDNEQVFIDLTKSIADE
jgi:hypothetical protein